MAAGFIPKKKHTHTRNPSFAKAGAILAAGFIPKQVYAGEAYPAASFAVLLWMMMRIRASASALDWRLVDLRAQ